MRRGLVLLAFLLWASPTEAAIAIVQHVAAGDAGTHNAATTASIDSTGATIAIASAAWYAGLGGVIAVSDSNDNMTWTLNTWTGLTVQTLSSLYSTRLFYAKNLTTSTTHYFRGTGTSTYSSIQVAVFSGVDLTTPFDQENGTVNGAFTTAQPGAVTPTNANSLVVSGITQETNASTLTINGTWAITDQIGEVGGTVSGGALAYNIQSGGPSSDNPTWTSSIATLGALTIASFNPTAAAAAGAHGFPLVGAGR